MKRVLALFLCILIFLSGCGKNSVKENMEMNNLASQDVNASAKEFERETTLVS